MFNFVKEYQSYLSESQSDTLDFLIEEETPKKKVSSGKKNQVRLYNYKNAQYTGPFSIGKEDNEF